MKMNIYKFVYSLFEWTSGSKRLVVAAFLLCPLLVSAQQKSYNLKGTVKDNNGGIPGVSVLVEGTTTGSITDQNGSYQLVLSTDKTTARIVFSFIGYKQIIHGAAFLSLLRQCFVLMRSPCIVLFDKT